MKKRHLSRRRRKKRIRLSILLSLGAILLLAALYRICDQPAPSKKGTIYNPTFELIKTETGFWGTSDFPPVVPMIKMRWKNVSGTTFPDSMGVKVVFQESPLYENIRERSPILCQAETILSFPLHPGEIIPIVMTGSHCFKFGIPEKPLDCHIYLAGQLYKTVSVDKKLFLDTDF